MTFGEGVREGRARFEVNALKGPSLLSAVVWEPTLPSWLVVCCFPFRAPDVDCTSAGRVGSQTTADGNDQQGDA